MRLLFALVISLPSCSANVAPSAPPRPPINPTAIALMNKDGSGHACPVERFVLTAEHVAYYSVMTQAGLSHFGRRQMYETQEGQRGTADPLTYNHYVDLAILTLDPPVEFFLKRGELPKKGDEVSWLEYDFRRVKAAFEPRVRRAKVVSTVAGHILLDEEPTPGASGSCLINDLGEAVGIVTFGHATEEGRFFGGAVDLTTLPVVAP